MHKRRRSRSAGHAGQAVRHVMASGGCCIGHCVVLYNSVLLYRILPDADPYGRFPGMPSLRSCIPRLRYLQTSSAGCHIPIFGVHPSFIDGFLRMPTRGGLPYRRCPPCGRTYPATSLQASCGCHILGRVFFRTDSRWRGGRRVICRMIPCCSILFCLYRRGRGFLYRGRLG